MMKFSDRVKSWEKRRELAAKLYEDGYSLREVGEQLKPACSPQAVFKLIHRHDDGTRRTGRKPK